MLTLQMHHPRLRAAIHEVSLYEGIADVLGPLSCQCTKHSSSRSSKSTPPSKILQVGGVEQLLELAETGAGMHSGSGQPSGAVAIYHGDDEQPEVPS